MTLATAEHFDPATKAYTAMGSMTVARSSHMAILLRNGKVLSKVRLRPTRNTERTMHFVIFAYTSSYT
jgi:hypothetical protein